MTPDEFHPPARPLEDLAEGTAAITPVTSETLDHAAEAAAALADHVAHAPHVEAPHAAEEHAGSHDAEPRAFEAQPAPAAAPEPAAAVPAPQAPARARGPVDAVGRYNAKLLEVAAANMAAVNQYWAALLGATSLTEAAAINADHVGRTLDAAASQGRELTLLAQKATFEALQPPTSKG